MEHPGTAEPKLVRSGKTLTDLDIKNKQIKTFLSNIETKKSDTRTKEP